MQSIDEDIRKEAERLGLVVKGHGQFLISQTPDEVPFQTQLPPFSSSDAGLNIDAVSNITSPEFSRLRFETRRRDLILHGDVSLEKILTADDYAQIRQDFGFGNPDIYKKQIAALDPESQKALGEATLRSVVALDSKNPNEPQFKTLPLTLTYLLTPSNDRQQQLNDAIGAPTRPLNYESADPDEKALGEKYKSLAESQNIHNPPTLYIRTETPPESQYYNFQSTNLLLKDHSSALVVDFNAFKYDKDGVLKSISDDLNTGNYASNESMEANIAKYGNVPARDILTKPEFADIRQTLGLDHIPFEEKPITPEYLDSLDPVSKSRLEKQTFSDIVDTSPLSLLSPVRPEDIPFSTSKYYKTSDKVIFELISPSNHLAQVNFLDASSQQEHSREMDKDNPISLIAPDDFKSDDQKVLYDHYQDLMTNKNKAALDNPPELYLRSYDDDSGAESLIFKDGTRAFLLNKSFASLPDNQLLQLIAHEAGHEVKMIQRHETNIYDYMERNATLPELIQDERDADKFAMGPHGTCDASGFGDALRAISLYPSIPDAINKITQNELNLLATGEMTHPFMADRLEVASHDAQQPVTCTPYYPPSAPDTPEKAR